MSSTFPVLAFAVSLAIGQQVFRSGTELVEVDAVVLDRDGQPVRGLTAADFELYDQGELQDISTFAFIDAPSHRPDAPAEPGLASTDVQRAAAVYLIVIDHLHTPSRTTNLVRQRAREFVEQHLGPSDLAAVVHLGLSSQAVEFSSSKPKLIAAIGGVKGSAGNVGESPTPDVIPGGNQGGGKSGLGAEADLDAFNMTGLERIERSIAAERAERAFEALGVICQYVAGFTGRRKSMLLFSEGVAVAPQELMPQARGDQIRGGDAELAISMAEGASRDVRARGALIDLARRSNMSLYTIDSRGLDASGAEAAPMAGVESQRLRWNSLRVLADETGGRAIVGYNDLTKPYAQIARDNGPYYLLGFRPRGGVDPSRFRELRVRVKRDDVQVFARKGYGGLADLRTGTAKALAKAWEGRTIRDLLDRPLPAASGELPIAAMAGVIGRSSGGKSRVLLIVEAEGASLPLEPRGELFANELEAGYRAIDAASKVAATRIDTARLQVSEKTRAAIASRGWRYLTTLDLAPGSYQLRVALRETSGGRAGTVFLDLDVPDAGRMPVTIESMLIGTSTSAATPTSAPDAALLKAFPMPPTARRAFAPSETLAVYMRVASKSAAALSLEIESDDGRKVASTSTEVGAERLGPGAAPLAIQMSLAALAPGRYVMTLLARPSGADGPVVTRKVPFEVVTSTTRPGG